MRASRLFAAVAVFVLAACGSAQGNEDYEREMRALLSDLNSEALLPSFQYADEWNAPGAAARRRELTRSYLELAARAERIEAPDDVAGPHARFVAALRDMPTTLHFGPAKATATDSSDEPSEKEIKLLEESNAKLKPLEELERALDEIERRYDVGWAEPTG